MAHNYNKIYAPFKREGPKDKKVKIGLWQNETFEYLKDLEWKWTEKIDGTSIGVQWDGERVTLVGHTEKSQIPAKLKKYLEETFCTKEAESIFESEFGEKPITFYGEGLSSETNLDYGFPEGMFILFDIYNPVADTWWGYDQVVNYANKFGVKVPIQCLDGTIFEAIDFIKQAPESFLKEGITMEGLVGRPAVELKMNNGGRVITKVKACDF